MEIEKKNHDYQLDISKIKENYEQKNKTYENSLVSINKKLEEFKIKSSKEHDEYILKYKLIFILIIYLNKKIVLKVMLNKKFKVSNLKSLKRTIKLKL